MKTKNEFKHPLMKSDSEKNIFPEIKRVLKEGIVSQILTLQEKPLPFAAGEELFWDDPHISSQMLSAHLDPTNDLASRRPETIDQSINWIIRSLSLKPGAKILDLGCGPGLYSMRLAQLGFKVTGVDYSKRSIDYATSMARKNQLEIVYRYQNYLSLEDRNVYDAVLLVYGDYCPLSPVQRERLLQNVDQALKPDGFFILDVTTRQHRRRTGSTNGWYVAKNGFWKPGLHLVLEQGFDYPEISVFLDQAIVIENNGTLTVYRNWFQDYSRETITRELERGSFDVQSVWNDLLGTPFKDDSEWIGVVAQKKKIQTLRRSSGGTSNQNRTLGI